MNLRVSQVIRYEYPTEVSFSAHALLLHPRQSSEIRLRRFSLNLTPAGKVSWTRDLNENVVAMCYFWDHARTLSIRTEFEVTCLEANPFDFILSDHASKHPIAYTPEEGRFLAEHLRPPVHETKAALLSWFNEKRAPEADTPSTAFLIHLNNTVFTRLETEPRQEPGVRSPIETIRAGGGSSRDLAALHVALARSLGYAARLVSGYCFALPDNAEQQEIKAQGNVSSSSTLHGWSEVYLPGAGWKGFDPSRGILCDEHYIPLAVGHTTESVRPIQGSFFHSQKISPKIRAELLLQKLSA